MHRIARRSVVVLAAVSTVLVVATGCSGDHSSDSSPSASPAPGTTAVPSAPSPTSSAPPQPDPALEVRDPQGRTPLVAATKARDVDAARALILAGADVNAKDSIQDSAYLYAGAEGLDEILVLTLSHGADLRSTNRFGGTALIPAAEKGHPSTVQLLIDAGVPLDHVNNDGWTALLEAVVYGDGSPTYQDIISRLLRAGADPNIRDAQGRTALQIAQQLGQTDVARLLGG